MLQHYSALAGLLALASGTPLSVKRDDNATIVKTFQDVPVSADLNYIPCFGNFSCANLEVPLDYDDASAGTTNIAFLKYSSPKQPAMGDIIFNPGGPGGSGVEFVLDDLALLTPLLGDSYNIIGMDPRGVNNSGPNTDCFAGSPSVRDFYITQLFDIEPRSNESISKYYEASGGLGTWCSQTLNDTVKYVNTPATARDMLQYFEKLAESEGKNCDEALVNYYGVSYGTVLGTTFASLYPDRVGRFIIDGVVDGEDYYFGNWSQNLLQADASVEAFFDICAKAGPLCALYGNGSTTADQIKGRVDTLLESMEENPIPVTDPNFVQFPTTITHLDLRNLMLTSMYNPPVYFPALALGLSELENGNASLLALVTGKGQMPLAKCDNASPLKSDEFPKEVIACNDNNKRYNGTEKNLFELFEYDEHLSTYLGSSWAPIIIPQCRNMNFTPPQNQSFEKFEKVKTKTPILFADNTIDPVTSSYYKMSAFYEGSVVLLQDALGHGLIVTTSNCTSGYVDNYLRTAELPPANTTCSTDFAAFGPSTNARRSIGLARRTDHLVS